MGRTHSLQKTLMLGMTEGMRRGQQRIRWLDGITDSMEFRQIPGDTEDRESWHVIVHGVTVRHNLVAEQQDHN